MCSYIYIKQVFYKPLWQYCLSLLLCLQYKKTALLGSSQLGNLVLFPIP